jgi:hypothetical protein
MTQSRRQYAYTRFLGKGIDAVSGVCVGVSVVVGALVIVSAAPMPMPMPLTPNVYSIVPLISLCSTCQREKV